MGYPSVVKLTCSGLTSSVLTSCVLTSYVFVFLVGNGEMSVVDLSFSLRGVPVSVVSNAAFSGCSFPPLLSSKLLVVSVPGWTDLKT